MLRSLLSLVGLTALTFSLLTPVDASPITIVANTVNNFRDTRGVNDVGIPAGDRNQFGANIIPATGSTITAVQGGFTAGPDVCAPLAVNANFCATDRSFSLSRLGSWGLTFRNGGDNAVIVTPTLDGAQTPVPFPQNVTITRTDHPTISFTIPAGFTADALRVIIFDKSVTLPNGVKDVIFSQAVSASATSFTIPSTVTLRVGNPYAINFQVIDLRPGFTEADFLASNNNAMILRRSSSFFDFQILGGGAPPLGSEPERCVRGPLPVPLQHYRFPGPLHRSLGRHRVRLRHWGGEPELRLGGLPECW